MTSHTTREFMAACAIMQRLGRPGTPTDQAWIESLFGHVKDEWPHLEHIRDTAELDTELNRVRRDYNTVRLHAASTTSHPTTNTTVTATSSAPPVAEDSNAPPNNGRIAIAATAHPRTDRDLV